VTRERRKDFLAVDDPAAFDRFCFGAECNATGGCRTAFRERLRINRAIANDTLVVNGAPAFVFGASRRIHLEIVGQRA
jgi:hypothetical protein